MKIRSVTVGVDPGWPVDSAGIQRAAGHAKRVREACLGEGLPVQTLRLSTPPAGSLLLGRSEAEIIDYARTLELICLDAGFDFCTLGPVHAQSRTESGLLAVLPGIIAATDTVFTSATVAPDTELASWQVVRGIAALIRSIAVVRSDGFGNLRFAALVACPPHIPFFPAAYHQGAPAFSLALEAADLVGAIAAADLSPAEFIAGLRAELGGRLRSVETRCRQLSGQGFGFRGIDLSPAPGPADADSIVYALEGLGYGRFGGVGTLAAAALVTTALQDTGLTTCGYCGLMLPVLEDAGLGQRNQQGSFGLSSLLSYSAVCGTGLDTIPLPGDATVDQLSALIMDVAALGYKLRKPLSARLLPIPGKGAGEQTAFQFEYFVNTTVMSID